MAWQHVTDVDKLEHGPLTVKSGRRQIALFRVDGEIFAVDNRCPHEGYPLAQGQVDGDCVLTCAWHNWKFRLQDGRCVLGGDHVRSYPVEQRDGRVLVDLSDPPPHEIEARILEGLKKAFDERDYGRICREIARLHYNKLDPLLAVRKALEWAHDRFEYGTTHAFAAAADWLALAHSYQDCWEERLVCLAEAVDHVAEDALRHPQHPFGEAREPFSREAFLDAVELEQAARAEGMTRHALESGLHWPDLEETFAEAALAHYNDFGHSLIYVYKARQLLDFVGEACESFVLPPLARHLCYTTREDLLPEFKAYANALQSMPAPAERKPEGERIHVPYPATVPQALTWIVEHASRRGATELYDALLTGIGRNLLHFDASYQASYEGNVQDNVGWLDFTHGITFSNAVRVMTERYPKLRRAGLLQMGCFLGRNARYLDLDLAEDEWRVEDVNAFLRQARDKLLDHGLRAPIFSAHLLKTTQAVEEELEFASLACRKYLTASLNRFLNSPIKQKHARRFAWQADALVKLDFERS